MKIEDILSRASDTKALRIGDGVIGETPAMFKQLFSGKRPVIIADPITWKIAGEKLQSLFETDGLYPDKPLIITDPSLNSEWRFIEQLDNSLFATDAVAVAVGLGTINDLAKLSSSHVGRRYISVGTAASMDGYTAYGASIIKDGKKQSFSCQAPLGFIADIDIISKAPDKITASGYADLFAKVTAGADWILADALGIETIDATAFNTVQKGLKKALADPQGLLSGNHKALYYLMEGLLLSGLAMQIHKSSRPTSGAEHQFSHLWNMEHHKLNGITPSHGFQVAIGTLATTALYEQMLAQDFSKLDVDKCLNLWPSLEEVKDETRKMFKDTDFPDIGETEMEAKYVDRNELSQHLNLLKNNWEEIKEKLNHQLIPYDQLRASLAAIGAPTIPEQIGISRKRLRESAIRAQRIRRRFTILDIARRTGNLTSWSQKLFPE